MFNLITLDGFFAGPNGEIDWHNVDDEFNEFAIGQLNSADGLCSAESLIDSWQVTGRLRMQPCKPPS